MDVRAQDSDAQPQTEAVVVNNEEKVAVELNDSASAVKALSDRDPQRRQTAAETLARLATSEHRRLVQGYRLQERDARVRLALDWALYRLGKPEALFSVVNALEAPQHREQAISYLSRLDDPTTLVALLKSRKRAVKTGALEALSNVGDEAAAKQIEPLVSSTDIEVAAAAQLALTEIERRLGKQPPVDALPTRPRQVGKPAGTENPI